MMLSIQTSIKKLIAFMLEGSFTNLVHIHSPLYGIFTSKSATEAPQMFLQNWPAYWFLYRKPVFSRKSIRKTAQNHFCSW